MQQRTFIVSRSAALVCTAAVLAFLPTVSQALGIGDLTLQSALSEPFRAEIELTQATPKDIKTLKANLVSPADFAAGSLPQGAPITRQLAVRIADQPDGRHVLELYSDQSIREPYVRFLLQLDWAGGRLTREFTALLDPRQGPLEGDTPVAETQAPTNTDTQASPVAQSSAAIVGTAPAVAPATVADAKPKTTVAPVDAKPAEATKNVQTPAPATKSPPAAAVSTSNQRERLASEIKTWAQTHTRAQTDTETPETDAADAAADTPIQQSSSARNRTAEMRRKITEHERANTGPAKQRQSSPGGWLSEHSDELLMAAVALVALLLVGFGTAWLMLTWRPRPTPGISLQPASLVPTEALEKRQRGGRRRQFVPVAIERRRGPRRQSDLPQPMLTPIDASEATGDSYPEDSVERALKDEISKHPRRLGLKLKLLALYHSRNDKASFETLLNNIYASAETELVSDEEGWPRFEDYDDVGASDGAAPVLTTVSPPPPDDTVAKTEKDSSTIEDAPAPTLVGPDVPEYPLLMDEQSWTDIDEGLLDLQSSLVEYEPAGVKDLEDLTVGPIEAADTGDFEHEVLHVDDLANVRRIVEQGMDTIGGKNGDQSSVPPSKPRTSKKGGKRKRKAGASSKRNEPMADMDGKGSQWRDPAKKIDLAKAYIDMGDAERARHILDEVLRHWHRGDGTDG
jgi:hypothetical protein